MKEFKSFYKTVGGNEGDKCHYSTRLDTYGCGCQHNCGYCYARSLLDFRGLWHPEDPAVADIEKIRKKVQKIEPNSVIRMGGMTDCFQPLEKEQRVAYETIKAMNENNVGYLIVTKSPLIAEDEYMDILDPKLAHIQVSVTSTDDRMEWAMEMGARPFTERVKAIEKLYKAGYDVSIRMSPYIPALIDADTINDIKCDKLLIEFLRVNNWIKGWLKINYSNYTVKSSGYQHMRLEDKVEAIKPFLLSHEVTICEDVTEHYEYFRDNVNPNRDDCCNLTFQK